MAHLMDGAGKHVGEVTKMPLTRAAYQRRDILTVLTDKQREVLTAANQYGYNDYPGGSPPRSWQRGWASASPSSCSTCGRPRSA